MFTIAAFSESQDLGGVEGNVAGVPDQHMRVEGDALFIGEFFLLIGAFACAGDTATLCRFVSPSLRRVNPHIIRPLELAITPADNPVVAADVNRAVPLDVNEGLECLLTSDPAAAEQASIIAFLADKMIEPVKGSIRTIHFQIILALVAGAWAYSEIDLIDELPVGAYRVVGAEFQVANGVAGRFVPVGGTNRPGCPTVPDEDNDEARQFRNGRFGEWFRFDTVRPPGVEILSSADAASSTYDCYMDIME